VFARWFVLEVVDQVADGLASHHSQIISMTSERNNSFGTIPHRSTPCKAFGARESVRRHDQEKTTDLEQSDPRILFKPKADFGQIAFSDRSFTWLTSV